MKRDYLIKSAYEARSGSKIVTFLNYLFACGVIAVAFYGAFGGGG